MSREDSALKPRKVQAKQDELVTQGMGDISSSMKLAKMLGGSPNAGASQLRHKPTIQKYMKFYCLQNSSI